MVIADLDHAISGSPPGSHLRNSERSPRDRVEGYIKTAKSIWKPVLPKPLSPVAMVDEGPKNSASATDDGQTVGEGPKPIATEEASDEHVFPKTPSPVRTVDESPKHSAPAVDGQIVSEGPEHPVPTENTSDVQKGEEQLADGGVAGDETAAEAPTSKLDPSADVAGGDTAAEAPTSKLDLSAGVTGENSAGVAGEDIAVKALTPELNPNAGVAGKDFAAKAPTSELNPNASDDKMKPTPADHIQQIPLGTATPATVSVTMADSTLEEIYAFARAKGVEFLHVFPQVKTEETQEVNVEQHDGQATTSSKGQLRTNAAGKWIRDSDNLGW
jgi:hypothetical protein